MTYINGASDNSEANVAMFESDTFCDSLLSISAVKDIQQGEELLLYYGDTFQLPPQQPSIPNAVQQPVWPRIPGLSSLELQAGGREGGSRIPGGGAKYKQTGRAAPGTPPAPAPVPPKSNRGQKRKK
jgi:hypothetical protein